MSMRELRSARTEASKRASTKRSRSRAISPSPKGVSADVKAQALFLERQAILGRPFLAVGEDVTGRRGRRAIGRAATEQGEQRRLTALAFALRVGGGFGSGGDGVEHLAPADTVLG